MRASLGSSIVLSLGLIAAWTGEASAHTATCEGWDVGGATWWTAAYVESTSTLYQRVGVDLVAVEISTDSDLVPLPPTGQRSPIDIGEDWTTSLSGDYVVVVKSIIYNFATTELTDAQKATWSSVVTIASGEIQVKGCLPPAPYCGDGKLGADESCDDGNAIDGDGCSSSCETERACGDGTTDESEECDDGNVIDGDGCSSVCITEAYCGDGTVDVNEVCDDGNVIAGDGCSAGCTYETYGCSLTQGYWKNHNRFRSNRSQRIAWPIDENTQLCGRTWLKTLETNPAGGNAFIILAHQYIAARLNKANNTSTGGQIDATIAGAEALFADCAISTAERTSALNYANVLDAYNNGIIGPGHCTDSSSSALAAESTEEEASGCTNTGKASTSGLVIALLGLAFTRIRLRSAL